MSVLSSQQSFLVVCVQEASDMDPDKEATVCGVGASSDRRSTSDQWDSCDEEEKCLIVDVVGESEDDDDATSTVEPSLSMDADRTGKVA